MANAMSHNSDSRLGGVILYNRECLCPNVRVPSGIYQGHKWTPTLPQAKSLCINGLNTIVSKKHSRQRARERSGYFFEQILFGPFESLIVERREILLALLE
jgi:hypothetical protein